VSRPALGFTQTPIQWVPGAVSTEAKRLGREAGCSPPSRGVVKNAWSYTTTPQYFMVWHLARQKDNFRVIFYRSFQLEGLRKITARLTNFQSRFENEPLEEEEEKKKYK
jgi:hypothetical protein